MTFKQPIKYTFYFCKFYCFNDIIVCSFVVYINKLYLLDVKTLSAKVG